MSHIQEYSPSGFGMKQFLRRFKKRIPHMDFIDKTKSQCQLVAELGRDRAADLLMARVSRELSVLCVVSWSRKGKQNSSVAGLQGG